MTYASSRRARPRAIGTLVAGALLVAGSTAPSRPALAQAASLVGSWTGLWDGFANGFVEYKIVKATSKALTVDYGYRPQENGPVSYERITCRATAPNEYNCGASDLAVTSPTSIDATMHGTNGHTAYATLSR